MSDHDDIDEGQDSFEAPSSGDGFDEPSAEVKRRNLITAGIISAIILVWVVYGLRGALF